MPSYSAPIEDIKYVLQDVLEIHDSPIPGYSELDNEYLNAILEEASKILGTWRLEEVTIAVTLEPDAMCAGAIVNARIRKLIYSAPNLKAGAAYSLYNIPQDPRLNHHVEIKDNILSHESEAILSSFFDSKR